MQFDALLNFVPIGGNLSMVAAAGVGIPSTNVIDLAGQGVGTAPGNIIGNRGTFGQDPGVGKERLEIAAAVGAALATANGAALNVALQYAADQGPGGGYQPGPWVTAAETGPIAVANLGAGAKLARLPFVPAEPEGLNPRYVRLLFTSVGGSFNAGTIAYAGVTLGRDDMAQRFAANNYAAP